MLTAFGLTTAVTAGPLMVAPFLAGPAGSAAAAPVNPLAAFKANSLTWVSPAQGWVLGTLPCGARVCTTVISTRDAGATWTDLARIPVRIPQPGQRGVTEIRFATPRVGWAFGPDLFRSTDGGARWMTEPLPGGVGQIVALATDAQATYAVVSPCSRLPYCRQSFSLWRTRTQAADWSRVPVNLPSGFAAGLSVYGSTVYVVEPQHDLTGGPDVFLASTDGGRHFSSRPVPCDRQPAVALIQVVATSPHDVALLCDGNPGFSKALKYVFTSRDTGRSDAWSGRMGLYGIQAQLAVSPSGNLAVASASDGSFMYIDDHAGPRWSMALGLSDFGVGWNDIQYVSDRTAWVVYGPVDFTDVGKLIVTHDGGRHWAPVGG